MSALTLDGIELALGGRPILRGASLALEAGELVGLVGRNGAGKSSLLRVASGVLRPDAGRVTLGSDALETLPRREVARRLAVVAQDSEIAFAFSAGELALMGRSPHLGLLGFETARDRALADRSVLELSGGERQLVIVARALAQEAPVVLLDEPTAHLDLPHQLQVLGLARELAREGRAVLAVSHDLSLLARYCDRLALLAGGRIETGPAEDLLRPDRVRAAFGVEVDLLHTPAGALLVVPR